MTRSSTTYALPLLVLLLLAAIPIWLHVLRGDGPDDCADPQKLFDVAGIPRSRLTVERAHNQGFVQRSEGLAPGPREATDIKFRIFRSYDRQDLILNPVRSLPDSYQIAMHPSELHWVDVGGERLPVYLQNVASMADMRVVAYFFVYRSRPLAHPFRAQLASALPSLLSGSPPLTLVSATTLGTRRDAQSLESAVLAWMGHAWEWYRSVCVR